MEISMSLFNNTELYMLDCREITLDDQAYLFLNYMYIAIHVPHYNQVLSTRLSETYSLFTHVANGRLMSFNIYRCYLDCCLYVTSISDGSVHISGPFRYKVRARYGGCGTNIWRKKTMACAEYRLISF